MNYEIEIIITCLIRIALAAVKRFQFRISPEQRLHMFKLFL